MCNVAIIALLPVFLTVLLNGKGLYARMKVAWPVGGKRGEERKAEKNFSLHLVWGTLLEITFFKAEIEPLIHICTLNECNNEERCLYHITKVSETCWLARKLT